MLTILSAKMTGKQFGESCIRYDGEILDYDPDYDEELMEYYVSWLEVGDGIFTDLMLQDPTETLQVYTTTHQLTKTVKKSNKKKSMEKRAKQKKIHRIDAIPELD